jgi:branched-chain amino acid transport system ATP-binding protein
MLDARGVTLRFGGVIALADVSVAVAQGELVGLIGPNGAGKTTLLNAISGLHRLQSGSIEFDGRTITGLPPYKIAKLGIARTFQVVRPFATLTVRENVAVGAMFSGARTLGRAEALVRAIAALEQVGLSAKATYLPSHLTMSERKRLELARALAMRPKLLLLDEVAAGLNQTEIVSMIELVRSLNKTGQTIIMVEHVMKAILSLCQRIVVLQFGKKIAEGTPQAVVSDPHVINAYLGARFAKRHALAVG